VTRPATSAAPAWCCAPTPPGMASRTSSAARVVPAPGPFLAAPRGHR
jgi:hypothetical protein